MVFILFLFNIVGNNYEETYLVKIWLPKWEKIYELEGVGFSILDDMYKYVLVETTPSMVKFLKGSKFKFQVLDKNPREKEYYFVCFVTEEKVKLLKEFGSILFFEDGCVFLRLEDKKKKEVLRGRWRIKKLMMEPMKIAKIKKKKMVVRIDSLLIEEIVSLVNQDSLSNYIRRLQDFKTRYSLTDSCRKASEWIYNKFRSFGIDSVFYQEFLSNHAPNVIATLVGSKDPEKIYIICAHYDSYSEDTYFTLAPGADDNASGTAVVIEVARVMSKYNVNYTLKFIAFAGEEDGLFGSNYYAKTSRSKGDSILGVINLDMVGYNAGSNFVRVYTNIPSEWFADLTVTTINNYVPEFQGYKQIISGVWGDYYSFWQQGYYAISFEEANFNPYCHTIGDTLGNLDPTYFTKVAKGAIATLGATGLSRIEEVLILLKDFSFSEPNDEIWDPGETVDIIVRLQNVGIDVTDVKGELTTNDPNGLLQGGVLILAIFHMQV